MHPTARNSSIPLIVIGLSNIIESLKLSHSNLYLRWYNFASVLSLCVLIVILLNHNIQYQTRESNAANKAVILEGEKSRLAMSPLKRNLLNLGEVAIIFIGMVTVLLAVGYLFQTLGITPDNY